MERVGGKRVNHMHAVKKGCVVENCFGEVGAKSLHKES